MKKTVIYFILILMVIPIHLFQILVLDNFRAFNVAANIFIIYLIFLSTYTNKTTSYIFALIYGLMFDISASNPVGITPIAAICIIELTILLNKILYINSRIATMMKALLLVIAYEVIRYVIRAIILKFSIEILPCINIALIEGIYLMLIMMLIYPVYKKIGDITDEKLNEKNVLTRYF